MHQRRAAVAGGAGQTLEREVQPLPAGDDPADDFGVLLVAVHLHFGHRKRWRAAEDFFKEREAFHLFSVFPFAPH